MKISISLIAKCQAKDRLAQKELYLKLLPYLRAVALRYLWNKGMEKDVIQEAFVLIFKNLDKFDLAKGTFVKWAVKITINVSLNYNNRVKFNNVEFELNKHDTPVSGETILQMSKEEVVAFLKKMPPAYFEVFNLFEIDGYSHDEIAEMLQINSSLSRKRLSRAKEWLKGRSGNSNTLNIRGVQFPKSLFN